MIKILNLMIDVALKIVAIVTVLVAGYIIYDGTKVTRSAVLGSEVLEFAPTDDEMDLVSLRIMNRDIIGWIRIFGTSINYPILQAEDNDYYLSRNYKGEFATAGSIFLDYRNDLAKDRFAIIYGHRMGMGGMFTDVTKYQDETYYDEHETGEIYIGEQRFDVEVVAFGLVQASNKVIYGVQSGALAEVLKLATYRKDVGDGRFMLLSTCDAKNKAMRDVLLLRIKE